jgi:hypothetical protein
LESTTSNRMITALQAWNMFLATQTEEQKQCLSELPPFIKRHKTDFNKVPSRTHIRKGLKDWVRTYLKGDPEQMVKFSIGNGRMLPKMTFNKCWANCLKVSHFLPEFQTVIGWDLYVNQHGEFTADSHAVLFHVPTKSWIDLTAYPCYTTERLFVRDGLAPHMLAGDWLGPQRKMSNTTYTPIELCKSASGGMEQADDVRFLIESEVVFTLSRLAETRWFRTLGEDGWKNILIKNSNLEESKEYFKELSLDDEMLCVLDTVQDIWETGEPDTNPWIGSDRNTRQLCCMALKFGLDVSTLNYKRLVLGTPGVTIGEAGRVFYRGEHIDFCKIPGMLTKRIYRSLVEPTYETVKKALGFWQKAHPEKTGLEL